MLHRLPTLLAISILAFSFILSGCTPPPAGADGKLQVVATTTIVGDIVKNIGGSNIDLTVLIPANVDEHGFEPTPQDIARVARAGLVFENGAGLETFLQKLMKNAGGSARLVSVSDGIPLQASVETDSGQKAPFGQDPHVWTDPNNVLIWVDNIEKSLSQALPENADEFKKNAEAYRQQLKDLDAWVKQQVDQIASERRQLVTDHLVFTYFASRYGFVQVGAVVEGYSTLAAPSAQDLARLEDSIRRLGVPVIFVGNTVNPTIAERVASDTNTRLVPILTGSLTDPNGAAPSYIEYIKYNVTTIVEALR